MYIAGKSEHNQEPLLVPQNGCSSLASSPLSLPALLNAPPHDPALQAPEFCGAAIMAAISLLGSMATAWSHLPAFPELFRSPREVLEQLLHLEQLPQVSCDIIDDPHVHDRLAL